MVKFFKKEAGRPHVTEAISKIVERYISGECFTSVNVPPRCGKSSIIHGAAFELREIGAPFCLAAVPWNLLTAQLSDPAKIKHSITRYAADLPRDYVTSIVKHLRSSSFYEFQSGVPDLLLATISLLQANRPPLLDAISSAYEATRQRPVIFVDEAHLLSKLLTWGKLIEECADNRAYIVVLTGTAGRRDRKEIPGFSFKADGEWQETEKRLRGRRVDPDGTVRHYIDTYAVHSLDGEDHADVTVKWREAFANGWLNQMNVHYIDDPVHIRQDDGTTSIVPVADIPKSQVRRMLREILETESVIHKFAQVAICCLCEWRHAGMSNTKCLVVTGSDELANNSKDRNKQARRILEALQLMCDKLGLTVRIQIATSVTETGEPDEKALGKVEAFRGVEEAVKRFGPIDILIVKTMGIVGLDIQEIKVMAHLSTIREGPLQAQLFTRPLTAWPESKGRPSDLILLHDALNVETVEELESMNGVVKIVKTEKIDEEEVPPPEPDEDLWLTGNDARVSGVANHRGEYFAGDNEDLLNAIKRNFLIGNLTDPEILINHSKGCYPNLASDINAHNKQEENGNSGVRNLTSQTEALRGKFGKLAKKYTNSLVSYFTDPDRWRDLIRDLQAEAKRRAGVNIPIETLDDPDRLKCCIEKLHEVYSERIQQRKTDSW